MKVLNYRFCNGDTAYILSVKVFVRCKEQLFITIRKMLASRSGGVISCINPHSYVLFRLYPDYKTAIGRSLFCIVDGTGFWLAATIRLYFRSKIHRITGRDLYKISQTICNQMKINSICIAPTRRSSTLLKEALTSSNSECLLSLSTPYDFRIDSEFIERAKELIGMLVDEVYVVYIFVGAPKQEILAVELQEAFPKCLFIPVGGVYEEIINMEGNVDLRLMKSTLGAFGL